LKKKKLGRAGKKLKTTKANHDRARRETLEERLQQEMGRDTNPGGRNSDRSRQPGNR
jgi:hypothetical protein